MKSEPSFQGTVNENVHLNIPARNRMRFVLLVRIFVFHTGSDLAIHPQTVEHWFMSHVTYLDERAFTSPVGS